MVSSSLTSFSWTSCRSHGFSEFSTALQSMMDMMDMMDVMDGGVMVAFLLLIAEFVRAVTICRVWPSSSCYLLLASMLGQWVRAWSESGVSWVWPPCFCYLFSTNMCHKGENKKFQTSFRYFHVVSEQWNECEEWRRLKIPRPTNLESTSSPLDPKPSRMAFQLKKTRRWILHSFSHHPPFDLKFFFPNSAHVFATGLF